jgi:sugar lactone lactonase YvrE
LSAQTLCAGPAACLTLDAATNEYVLVPASTNFTPSAVTFEAWVYPTEAMCNTVLSRGDGSSGATTDFIFDVGYDGTTCGVMKVGFFGAGAWDASASLIPLNAWTHVAVTFNGTNKQFFINGVLDATRSRPGTLYQSGSALFVGRQGTGCDCNFFQGGLSEVRIWNAVRTASQIASDMNVSPNGSQSNLVAYYHLNEGSGTTANDTSGNGHTGTLLNGAGWAYTQPVFLGTSTLLEGPTAGTDCDLLAAPSTYSWTAATNVSWLHLSATNQSGKGSTNIVFTFDANTGPTRAGTLTIAGLTLSVTQAGSTYVPATLGSTTLASALNSPEGVAVDGAGIVYVSEEGNNTVAQWSPASNTVSTVVSSGLTHPAGVAIDQTTNIYTVDGDNTAKEWVAATKAGATLVTGLSSPNGVAVDGFGNLYIGDTFNNVVKKWSVGISATNTLVSGLEEPYGVAVDGAGNVYFVNTKLSEVQEWLVANTNVTTLASSGLNQPRGLAVDAAGNVFFADTQNNAVKEWSPATGSMTTLVSNGLSQPWGVAVDAADNVYFADSGNNAIKELPRAFLDPTTKYETAAAGTDTLPAVLPTSENLLAPFAPTTNQSWLSITGTANGVVSFSFTTNNGTGRTGTITLLGQSITIIQPGAPNSGVLSTTTLAEGPNSGSDSVGLVSLDTPWTATANASWLHLSPANQSGTNSATVTFTFDANAGGTRTGTLTIAGQTLTVIQAGSTYVATSVSNAYVDPTPKFESDTAVSDTLPPVVPSTQNLTGTNAPTSDQPWLTITGVANGVVSFTFGTNFGGARLAHITLLGQSIPIAEPVLGASTRFDGPAAGTDSIVLGVATGTPAWTATANASWLHLSTTNGLGSSTLIFNIDANTGATRSGTMTIGAQTLTVTQAGSTYVATQAPVTRLAPANNPYSVAVDTAGNVYFPYDQFHIEEWVLTNNSVTTLVSSGINSPDGVAVDRGRNVYFADSANYAIKEWVALSNSVVTIVSGASNVLTLPDGVALDLNSNIYIGDRNDNAFKEWSSTTRNVTTLISYPQVQLPAGVATDAAGNAYLADTDNNAIKEWSPVTSNYVNLVAAPTVNRPYGVAVDGGGNVFIADTSDNAIKEWSAVSSNVTTLLSLSPNDPHNLAVDANGNLYITDDYYNYIEEQPRAWTDPTPRQESAASGVDALPPVVPSTENLLPPFTPTSDQPWLTITGITNDIVSFSVSANSGLGRIGHITVLGQSVPILQAGTVITLGETNRVEGPAAGSDSVVLASLYTPWTVTANAPWLHLSAANQSGPSSTNVVFSFDANTNTTRTGTLTIAGQTLTVTQAGSTYVAATSLTTLVSSGFHDPNDVAVDGSGNVFIVDEYGTLREWTPVNNTMSELASNMNNPQSVAVDGSGNAYVADTGDYAIDEWLVAGSTFTNLVPSGTIDPNGVAVDASGNVYISDAGDFAIKEWSPGSNNLSVLIAFTNGTANSLSIDVAGNLYFLYFSNSFSLQEWSAQTRASTTLASSGLQNPQNLAMDGTGNVFIADRTANAIKVWNAASNIVTSLISAGLYNPYGVAVDALGNVYIAEAAGDAVEEWPRAFFDPSPRREPALAGSDALPGVLPASENLLPPFAPSSDQSWLTITGTTGGVVSFSFLANNSGASRTANVYIFGIAIPITQNPVVHPTLLTGATVLPNGSFQFTFTNSSGAPFTVLTTTNVTLPLNQWTPVGAPVESPAGHYTYTSATTDTNTQQYYTFRSP